MESHQRPRHAIGSAAAFRPSAKQYALHPLEKALMLTVIALLVFLPWALGGMKLWAQWTAFGLAAISLRIALIPRSYDNRYHADGNLRLHMWPKLRRFPVFWLGLVYFTIIIIQICNPAWTFRSSSVGWWLVAIDYIEWLPHGISGNSFEQMNGWRTLLIQVGVWLLICSIWVGITRRKAARLIATAIALNGLLIAVIVILQRLTQTKKMLWLWEAPSNYFAATLVYKNHAGEYLGIILALCFGLAWWHMHQAEREFKKSNPSMVWVLCALLVLVGQMFTFARAATAVGAAFSIVVILSYVVRLFFRRNGSVPPVVSTVSAMLAIAMLAVALTQLDTGIMVKRFERLFTEDLPGAVGMRKTATIATIDMAKDDLVFGHGAGGFRFLFPLYQQHYPEIWTKQSGNGSKVRLFWEYAHNDYAQFLAEMGLVGIALAGLMLTFIVICAWQVNISRQFSLLLMLGGLYMILVTAAVDFPLHNPAVLYTTAAVATLVLRWGQLTRRV